MHTGATLRAQQGGRGRNKEATRQSEEVSVFGEVAHVPQQWGEIEPERPSAAGAAALRRRLPLRSRGVARLPLAGGGGGRRRVRALAEERGGQRQQARPEEKLCGVRVGERGHFCLSVIRRGERRKEAGRRSGRGGRWARARLEQDDSLQLAGRVDKPWGNPREEHNPKADALRGRSGARGQGCISARSPSPKRPGGKRANTAAGLRKRYLPRCGGCHVPLFRWEPVARDPGHRVEEERLPKPPDELPAHEDGVGGVRGERGARGCCQEFEGVVCELRGAAEEDARAEAVGLEEGEGEERA